MIKDLLIRLGVAATLFTIVPNPDWSAVASKLARSVVYIESTHGSCTGFVIRDDAKGKDHEDVDYVLTAAHCDGPQLFVDQTDARVLWKDTKKDLLILEVKDLSRPALVIADKNPTIGEAVASYGFGWGLERALFRTATVSDDKTYIPVDGIGGPLIVIDAVFVLGQSGGPVIDATGTVVAIVQRGGEGVGLGVGAETIRDKVGRFLQKASTK